MALARGARTGGAEDVDVGAGEDCVEGGGESAVRSRIKNRNWAAYSPRAMCRVAGLLGHPGAGGMGGDPGEAHAATAVLDDYQDELEFARP
jgi:hypothetical protein